MSAADIADNKWELEASKPPLKDAGSIAQVVLVGGLATFFLFIVVSSLIAIISPPKEGSLADQYKNMESQAEAAAAPRAEEAAPPAE